MDDNKFHHVNTPHPHSPAADLSHFYVITTISNPWRYKKRYSLYWKFKEMVESAGVKLITVEQAFGNRPFMVTEAGNPFHVQVRSAEELWLKENMVNLGVQRAMHIDSLAREVAWVDADCEPMGMPARQWFELTWHLLQNFEFVQMWRHLVNMGPDHEVIGTPQPGFVYSYRKAGFQPPRAEYKGLKNTEYTNQKNMPGQFGRPGLAWAANVDAFNKVGGLVDFCILGSGDWHMAHALVGAMTEQTTLVGTLRGHGSQEYAMAPYTEALLDWQRKCERWIKRDVGYVGVTVSHSWHGKYKNRKYGSRGRILVDNQFNPYTDVKKDSYGLLQLETWDDRQIRIRDFIRDYFATRDEDSTDM